MEEPSAWFSNNLPCRTRFCGLHSARHWCVSSLNETVCDQFNCMGTHYLTDRTAEEHMAAAMSALLTLACPAHPFAGTPLQGPFPSNSNMTVCSFTPASAHVSMAHMRRCSTHTLQRSYPAVLKTEAIRSSCLVFCTGYPKVIVVFLTSHQKYAAAILHIGPQPLPPRRHQVATPSSSNRSWHRTVYSTVQMPRLVLQTFVITYVSTVRDWFRRIGMRARGWRVGFPSPIWTSLPGQWSCRSWKRGWLLPWFM